MSFHYSNGEERKVTKAVSHTLHKTIFYHSTRKASDATFAVKFLKTRTESEIGASRQLYSKFLAGQLCLAVLCPEQIDNRLVEYFALDEHLPVHIITIKMGHAEDNSVKYILNQDLEKIAPIHPSPLSKARMGNIFEALQKPTLTGIPSDLYEKMIESYMKSPDRKKRTWHKNLYDRDGNESRVIYQNGKLYETDGALNLKEIGNVSAQKLRNGIVLSEWGELFRNR